MNGIIAPLLGLLLAMPSAPAHVKSVDIALAHDSTVERQTRDQLERLIATHDLSLWLFSRSVVIDSDAIPHSHPVLTLHTRHLNDDDLLLSTFIHEQLHWFLVANAKNVNAAIHDLKKLHLSIPIGYPQGSTDERSNYVHLIIGLLEHDANQRLIGEMRASRVLDFWASDHYTWIYRTVRDQERDIRLILDSHQLLLPEAAPAP